MASYCLVVWEDAVAAVETEAEEEEDSDWLRSCRGMEDVETAETSSRSRVLDALLAMGAV